MKVGFLVTSKLIVQREPEEFVWKILHRYKRDLWMASTGTITRSVLQGRRKGEEGSETENKFDHYFADFIAKPCAGNLEMDGVIDFF
jgi:hypothetical protein